MLIPMSQESRPFNNRSLFSNHYLLSRIQKTDDWMNEEGSQEAFKRINWIRPIFDILGHYYGVQEKDTDDFYKNAVAVGDAKAWKILLDKSRQGKAQYEMTNPSYQIDDREKQNEIKGFLGWLEMEIGAKIEDLTLKTKIRLVVSLIFSVNL